MRIAALDSDLIKGGNGQGGNPTSAITLSGKVVRGYQVFSVSYPGYLIILESLTGVYRCR
jgi:hypothetical protein